MSRSPILTSALIGIVGSSSVSALLPPLAIVRNPVRSIATGIACDGLVISMTVLVCGNVSTI
jgi:hypothetical protein